MKKNFEKRSFPNLLTVLTLSFLVFMLFLGLECNNDLDETSLLTGDCEYTDIQVMFSPDPVTIAPGETADVTVTVTIFSNCTDFAKEVYVRKATDVMHPHGHFCSTPTNGVAVCDISVNIGSNIQPGLYEHEYEIYVSSEEEYSGVKESRKSTLNVNVMQENDFSIHAPNSMGVIKGQSTTADITIERTGEHNQEISLSLWTTIPIPGLNPSYEPNTIPGDESFSQLTITTNHYTIPGTFNVAVLGNDGVNNRFVYFTLYINEPFDLSLPQESVSIAQGDSVFVDVNISNKVGGWNSQVAMTVENDIIGQGESLVDTAFSPNPIPWDESSSRLKLVVGNAVPPGSYPLTITGTIPTEYRTAELQLTVIEGKSY